MTLREKIADNILNHKAMFEGIYAVDYLGRKDCPIYEANPCIRTIEEVEEFGCWVEG